MIAHLPCLKAVLLSQMTDDLKKQQTGIVYFNTYFCASDARYPGKSQLQAPVKESTIIIQFHSQLVT